MKTIVWNCRGLGLLRTVRGLKDLVRSENPSILGLIETKIGSKDLEFLRVKLGFRNCFSVDSCGRSGGLALLWNQDLDLNMSSYSRFHIDAIVRLDCIFRITLFFKVKATRRKERKWISHIELDNGQLVYEDDEIRGIFLQYFRSLFTSQTEYNKVNWTEAMQNIPNKVTEEMNCRLTEPYTEEEVKRATFELHPDKAPGLDGFSAVFYQKFWDIIKGEVCTEILTALNSGSIWRIHE